MQCHRFRKRRWWCCGQDSKEGRPEALRMGAGEDWSEGFRNLTINEKLNEDKGKRSKQKISLPTPTTGGRFPSILLALPTW